MRKSISGLGRIIEEDYETDPRARCLTVFCGCKVDRFKIFLYDGDGYCLLTKVFRSKRLVYPRLGGHIAGEMWWISHDQFQNLMNGFAIPEDEVDGEEKVPEPVRNTVTMTLFKHALTSNAIPLGIYLCCGYTDMRKSIHQLSSMVTEYGLKPQSGSWFFFTGRQPDRFRLLFFDRDGYMLISKFCDNGRYQWPRNKDEIWKITCSQLFRILLGEVLSRDDVLRVLQRVIL